MKHTMMFISFSCTGAVQIKSRWILNNNQMLVLQPLLDLTYIVRKVFVFYALGKLEPSLSRAA